MAGRAICRRANVAWRTLHCWIGFYAGVFKNSIGKEMVPIRDKKVKMGKMDPKASGHDMRMLAPK